MYWSPRRGFLIQKDSSKKPRMDFLELFIIIKMGIFGDKHQIHYPDWTITLFGNYQLCFYVYPYRRCHRLFSLNFYLYAKTGQHRHPVPGPPIPLYQPMSAAWSLTDVPTEPVLPLVYPNSRANAFKGPTYCRYLFIAGQR